MILPITFSIPAIKVVTEVPDKTRILSEVIPGKPYSFENEEAYYQNYRTSCFALTCKKAGWDCLRHYEILACGCIPYFPDIDQCPDRTMYFFPKHLIRLGNDLYESIRHKTLEHLTASERCRIHSLTHQLLGYTRSHLVSHRMAEYLLQSINANPETVRILFLSGCTKPDYLRCLTLTGLKEILGRRCQDVPRVSHLYRPVQNASGLYGRGFTYTGILDDDGGGDDGHDDNHEIQERIRDCWYDVIVYGSMHRGLPYWETVMAHYRPEDVVLMCGEDSDGGHVCLAEKYSSKGHFVFVRELC